MMMHIASSLGFCESNIWTSFPLPCKLPKYSRSSVRKRVHVKLMLMLTPHSLVKEMVLEHWGAEQIISEKW